MRLRGSVDWKKKEEEEEGRRICRLWYLFSLLEIQRRVRSYCKDIIHFLSHIYNFQIQKRSPHLVMEGNVHCLCKPCATNYQHNFRENLTHWPNALLIIHGDKAVFAISAFVLFLFCLFFFLITFWAVNCVRVPGYPNKELFKSNIVKRKIFFFKE